MTVADPGEDVRSLEQSTASIDAPADRSDDGDNFRVVVRIRPPLPRELQGDRPFIPNVRVQRGPDEEFGRAVTITEHLEGEEGSRGVISSQTFAFDTVYDQHSSQKTVYCHTAREAVLSMLQGYNATIIAYGQTGTGKTYTMEGFTGDSHRGVIPRATEEIFAYINDCPNPRTRFLVRASYLQIYNEVISDLIKPQGTAKLLVREDRRRGVYVEGLTEWIVRSPQDAFGLIDEGGKQRMTGTTRMSELSSRSHAIFTIVCEQADGDGEDDQEPVRIGKLNFVDLAGSEKVRQTGATGQRLEESKKINLSLSALGNVIAALTDPRARHHVPYRDSKLTRILEDSLGGNCRTTMIAMVSPAMDSYYESLSTLKFASRAKCVRNKAVINEDLDQKAELRRCERELRQLRAALAEATRDAAECRRRLGCGADGAPQSERRAGDSQPQGDLENATNRSMSHEHGGQPCPPPRDSAEAAWFQELLGKQRDVMVELTERLEERDAVISRLEAELDAYDAALWRAEEALAARGQGLGLPEDSAAGKAHQEAASTAATAATGDTPGGELRQRVRALCGELAELQAPAAEQPGPQPDSDPEHRRRATAVQRLLEERVEAIVAAEVAHRARAPDPAAATADVWQRRCQEAEERLKVAEQQMEQLQGSIPEECERRARALLVTEAESLKRPYLARIATLDTQLQTAEEERTALRAEVDLLTARLHRPENSPRIHLSATPGSAPAPDSTPELLAATQLVEHLQQERRALRTILSDKVRRRVDAAAKLLRDGGGGGGGAGGAAPEPVRRAEEQLARLQALLGATLRAMADNP